KKRTAWYLAMVFGFVLLVACPALLAAPHRQNAPAAKVDFNRDIRPILSANCFACHGQDPVARQANLRLDIRDSAVELRSGRRAIEPGHPEKSALVTRIHATNPALLMPPAGSNHKL